MKVTVKKPTQAQLAFMKSCPVWEHDVGEFSWRYEDKRETCLIIEGKGAVEAAGETTRFEAGDLVIFPTHWECVWKITEPIKKYYAFDAEL